MPRFKIRRDKVHLWKYYVSHYDGKPFTVMHWYAAPNQIFIPADARTVFKFMQAGAYMP